MYDTRLHSDLVRRVLRTRSYPIATGVRMVRSAVEDSAAGEMIVRRSRTQSRGTRVQVYPDLVGLYVGTSPTGVDWICYEHDEFCAQCAAFDEAYQL